MKRLFIDTAGWMAMADAKDPLHQESVQFRDQSLDQGAILITSTYILDETLTLIRMRLGIMAAEKWWGWYLRALDAMWNGLLPTAPKKLSNFSSVGKINPFHLQTALASY